MDPVNQSQPAVSTDYYRFVNARWLESTDIPEEHSRWGNFDELRENGLGKIMEILQDESMPRYNQPENLARQFYKIAMNGRNYNTDLNLEPIQQLTDMIDNIENFEQLFTVVAKLFKNGVCVFFHLYRDSDPENPDMTIPHINQFGLTLPDRSYYLETDNVETIQHYRNYISGLYNKLSGHQVDDQLLDFILNFESEKAKVYLTRTEKRNIDKVYNIRKWSELPICLSPYFEELGIDSLDLDKSLIIDNPQLLEFYNRYIVTLDLELFKKYLKFKVYHTYAPFLDDNTVDIYFQFNGKILNGQSKMTPRWKRVVSWTDKYVGDIVGKMYVERHFPESSRQYCLDMIKDICQILHSKIENSSWMLEDTKREALCKLKTFRPMIGFPDKWHSYDGLWSNVDPSTPLSRLIMEWNCWDWKVRELPRLYSLIDKELWHMTPQTVNAYYDPSTNIICFPAGILQPPFFDPVRTYAQNLGGIGLVIAHEITHGFDDQGRKYDSNGKLRDWWQPEDIKKYINLVQPVVEQYSRYRILGEHVNGQLTLGENLADIGGCKLAIEPLDKIRNVYMRLHAYREFFQSFATVWRTLVRSEFALKMLKVDPHSPPEWRVNGVVGHLGQFYLAYPEVDENSLMYLAPEKRLSMW